MEHRAQRHFQYRDVTQGDNSFSSSIKRLGLTRRFGIAARSPQCLRGRAIDRLDDRVVNRVLAIGAMRLPHKTEITANMLTEDAQTLRAGDRNIRLPIGIIPVSLNPEWCRMDWLPGR